MREQQQHSLLRRLCCLRPFPERRVSFSGARRWPTVYLHTIRQRVLTVTEDFTLYFTHLTNLRTIRQRVTTVSLHQPRKFFGPHLISALETVWKWSECVVLDSGSFSCADLAWHDRDQCHQHSTVNASAFLRFITITLNRPVLCFTAFACPLFS